MTYQQELHHALPCLLHQWSVGLDLLTGCNRHGTGSHRLGALFNLLLA